MNNPISEAATILTDPDFFRAAVNFTARRTGFAARLIEKDYSDFDLERAIQAVIGMAENL
jgi:hypothetical protein